MYIEKLYELMHKAPQETEEITECTEKLVKYVNIVMMHQIQQERLKVNCIAERISQEDFIYQTERLNKERNNIHDDACIACHNLNLLAERAHMPIIFEFELEMEERNGIRSCSQNNHYVVSSFCAQVVNELYEDGMKEYEPAIIDAVTYGKTQPYTERIESLQEAAAKWVAQLNETNLKERLANEQKEFILKDGVSIKVTSPYQPGDISVDAEVSGKSSIKNVAGKNAFYFEQDGKGYDIPVSVLQEIAIQHGGFMQSHKHSLEEDYEH